MPRRRNQSPDTPSSGKDSTEKVPKDNDVQLRWRENTLFELQNMFSGSIDPGVVQLVLSESDYNVNDAVEKLFVLSGIEQGQTESQAIPDTRPSKSSLENQKPNYQHGISNAGRVAHKVDSQFKGIQAGASSDNSSSSVIKSSFTQTSKGKKALLSQYSTSDGHHQGEVPRSLPHYKPASGVSYGADRTVSPEGVLLHVGTDNTSSVTSSGLPDFPDYVALQFNTLTNQANTPYAEQLSSQKPTIHQRDMQSEDLEPPAGPDHCEHSKPKTINLPIHDQELKGNLESYNKQVISGSSGTEQTKKKPLGCSEKKPLDFEFSRKEQQVESSSATDRSDNTNPRVSCNEGQRTSNDHNCNYNHLNFYQNTSKTSLKHKDDTPQLQHRTNTVQQLQLHHNENSKSKETMSQPPAIQRQIYPYLRPQGFSQTSNVSQQRFPLMPVVPAVWHPGLLTQRFPGHDPTQYLQGPLSTNPCFSFGAPRMAAVTRPVRHGFGVRGSMSPPTKQKVLILMRGLPGSGKTFLAQYKFDASSLGEAHEWNQSRAKTAMESQQSLLIIDNTNTQSWEMKPYISMAVKYGYHIKIVEPNTPWKWDVKELVRRNQHGVTYAAITRMKERYEHNLSVETLKKSERHTDARKTEDELETKKCVDEEQENDERACETCTGEASKEVHITSMVNCDEYLESEKALEHEVCDGNPDPKDRTFDEDVSTSKQSHSNLPYLLNPLQPSSSENSQNQRHAGLEFLKTCFPDVDCDLMNAILTAKGGDLTKVVDELLMHSKAPSAELSTFPADSLYFASQQEIFDSPSRVAQKSSSPTEETVNATSAPQTQSNVGGENNKLPGELSSQMYLAPKVSSQAQSPRSNTTFQLTLEPAVALHLIELFGPFAGVDFQDNISREDLVIAVDCSLARQLYKKWEHTIQTRKGIPVAGLGCKQRAKGKPTVNNQLDRDQIPDIQQSTPRFPTEPQATGTLREIMDEQLAVELSRNLPNVTEQDMATKLKKQKLFEMFPGVDPVALEEVFQANGFELAPSVEAVKASCNLSGQDAPTTVIASGFSGRFVDKKATKEEGAEDWSWLDLDVPSRPNSDVSSFQTLEDPSYLDYRAEAFQHYNLRDECFKKAALAFSKKQGQLAQFYAQQGHLHTEKIKEANARAAALILDQKNELTDDNTIDLHGLHVTEAIEALENMLSERIDSCSSLARKGCKFLNVVTGRGNHSRGGKARIKPAIIEYLKKHNYRFTEPHPGLVKVFL